MFEKEKFDKDSVQDLICIKRILSKNGEEWNPGLKDLKEHDFSPMWTASVLFLILDRYTSNVSDDKQLKFVKDTLFLFEKMREEGLEYLYRLEVE